MSPAARAALRWAAGAAVVAVITAAMLAARDQLDKAHVALLYLLVVLLGTVSGGRTLGLALAAVAFLLFNFLFLPPYYTLAITNPLDWLVLVAFLVVSAVVAQILHRYQVEAREARLRTAEVDRLAQIGAESLRAARADEARESLAAMIRATLGLTICRIHVRDGRAGKADRSSSGRNPGSDPIDPLVTLCAENARVVLKRDDGTTHVMESAEVPDRGLERAVQLHLPLQVRGRTVGVLELGAESPISLSPADRRYLAALGYYAALAVERARLEAEADHVQALREADRLKTALLASVSHDLRTPLTTIKALAHDLTDRDDRAAIIEEEADRLNRLVADLLDLSRLQGGGLTLDIGLNAVDDLVGAVAQRVSGLLAGRPLELDLGDEGALMVGRFDFSQALRILVNLIENAHKYAPPGTPIELSVVRRGNRLEFAVADRGPGVPPEERERVFEPFYRSPAVSPDTGGAGLGLAIARQLARAQDGDVTYRPREGGGASFVLTLPAADLTVDPTSF